MICEIQHAQFELSETDSNVQQCISGAVIQNNGHAAVCNISMSVGHEIT